MTHDLCAWMHWCRRCGRPEEEIVNQEITDCDGLRGVIHMRYREAKVFNDATMGRIVDSVMAHLKNR